MATNGVGDVLISFGQGLLARGPAEEEAKRKQAEADRKYKVWQQLQQARIAQAEAATEASKASTAATGVRMAKDMSPSKPSAVGGLMVTQVPRYDESGKYLGTENKSVPLTAPPKSDEPNWTLVNTDEGIKAVDKKKLSDGQIVGTKTSDSQAVARQIQLEGEVARAKYDADRKIAEIKAKQPPKEISKREAFIKWQQEAVAAEEASSAKYIASRQAILDRYAKGLLASGETTDTDKAAMSAVASGSTEPTVIGADASGALMQGTAGPDGTFVRTGPDGKPVTLTHRAGAQNPKPQKPAPSAQFVAALIEAKKRYPNESESDLIDWLATQGIKP